MTLPPRRLVLPASVNSFQPPRKFISVVVIIGSSSTRKGWKDIIEMGDEPFQFCHSMKLRNGWQAKFCERWFVQPLGLESGRWIYLGVQLKWKIANKILRYDIATGKMDDTGKELGSPWGMYCVLGYRNSMAALPPINVPILQD